MKVGDAEWLVSMEKIDRARDRRDMTANQVAALLAAGDVETARRLAVTDFTEQHAVVMALGDEHDHLTGYSRAALAKLRAASST